MLQTHDGRQTAKGDSPNKRQTQYCDNVDSRDCFFRIMWRLDRVTSICWSHVELWIRNGPHVLGNVIHD